MRPAGPPAIVHDVELDVKQDVEHALARYGLRPQRLELVSPLGERKGVRFAYRADGEDGRIVKARHFASAENAFRHSELRAGLDHAFAPVLARYDCVIIEEWVEGHPLDAVDADMRIEEAGALLGRLHARQPRPGASETIGTAKWSEGAESDLDLLVGARALAAEDAGRLRAEVRRSDPVVTRAALIHLDFCAENMLIDGRAKLRIIDNELLAIGPATLDLGRTFHRWPMPSEAWSRFLRAYRSTAPSRPEPLGFWKIAAALTGTRVFLQRDPERLDGSLALLRRFAAGESLADPAP